MLNLHTRTHKLFHELYTVQAHKCMLHWLQPHLCGFKSKKKRTGTKTRRKIKREKEEGWKTKNERICVSRQGAHHLREIVQIPCKMIFVLGEEVILHSIHKIVKISPELLPTLLNLVSNELLLKRQKALLMQ